MSQKIDPTGFPKGVWGVVLDYTAPSTQDAIVYRVNNRPPEFFDRVYNLQGAPHEYVRFDYRPIAQIFNNHLEFGEYYDLPKVDKQIRVFAMTTFIMGFGGKSVVDSRMNLRESIIHNMNMGLDLVEGTRTLVPILQRLGLVEERVVDSQEVPPVAFEVSVDRHYTRYVALPQPDEPKEPVKLEKSDVTVENVTPPQS